jgi:excisionase family DNA binding protein
MVRHQDERWRKMTTPKAEFSPERLAYSINEFASATDLSRAGVYRLIRDGELKAVKLRGRQLIPASEVRRIFGGETA